MRERKIKVNTFRNQGQLLGGARRHGQIEAEAEKRRLIASYVEAKWSDGGVPWTPLRRGGSHEREGYRANGMERMREKGGDR